MKKGGSSLISLIFIFVSIVFILFFAFIIVMEVKIYNLETKKNVLVLRNALIKYKSENLKHNVDSVVRLLNLHSQEILKSSEDKMTKELSDMYLLCFHTYVFNQDKSRKEIIKFLKDLFFTMGLKNAFIISSSGKIIYFPEYERLVGKNVGSVKEKPISTLSKIIGSGVKKYTYFPPKVSLHNSTALALEYFEPLKIYIGTIRQINLQYISSVMSKMLSRIYKKGEPISIIQITNQGGCPARILINQENPSSQGECISNTNLPILNTAYLNELKTNKGILVKRTIMENGKPSFVIVYMRLYKPLNWVVESWFYQSNISPFVSSIGKAFKAEIKRLFLSFIPTITALFILGIIYLIFMAKIQEAELILRELTKEAMTTQVPIQQDKLPSNSIFNSREFRSMVETVNEIVEYFNKSEEEIIESFIVALETRDIYTKGHSQRVAYYSKVIAEALGLPEDKQMRIYTAGLLHDIGKIGIPDYILLKPELLTDQEYEIVKYHPLFSYYILKEIERFKDIAEIVKYHHERCDGSGYPEGRQCKDIPLESRILAMADIFDALTTKRPYRESIPPEEAIHMLEMESVDESILNKARDALKGAYIEEENVEVRFTPAELERVRQHLFRIDTLTGLPKKEILLNRINEFIDKNISFTLCMVRLNNLHRINYETSFLVGDKIIGYAGAILKESMETGTLPGYDTMARVFEGTFVFIRKTPDKEETENSKEFKETLKSLLSKDLRMILIKRHPNLKTKEGKHISELVDFEISCVLYPDDATTVSDLIRECETRLRGKG